MKTVVAVRHLHFEGLGTLEPLLQARGYTVHYVEATQGALPVEEALSADLLVMLGGPIGAFDETVYPCIADELALVSERLELGRPLLGICLGAQLMARALGAGVAPMGVKEIGFSSLSLTSAGAASALGALGDVPVLHWHGDRFEIPAGTTRLAGSAVCDNQAFAFGRHVLALQCHLEVDLRQIEAWLIGHACELGQAGLDPRVLRQQALALQDKLEAASQAVFGRWLDDLEKGMP